MKKKSIYIHPTAIINSTKKIGSGTKIWVNVQIRENGFLVKRKFLLLFFLLSRSLTNFTSTEFKNERIFKWLFPILPSPITPILIFFLLDIE